MPQDLCLLPPQKARGGFAPLKDAPVRIRYKDSRPQAGQVGLVAGFTHESLRGYLPSAGACVKGKRTLCTDLQAGRVVIQ